MPEIFKDRLERRVGNRVVFLIMAVTVVTLGGLLMGCLFAADLLFGTGILKPGWTPPAREGLYLETAKSRVLIGSRREDALQALSDAWFHTECIDPNDVAVAEDLFFYGPHNPDGVTIIHVMYREDENGNPLVAFVGQVENYMLHLYEHCNPPPYEAFGNVPTSEH